MSEWFEIEDQDDVELSKDGRSIEILFNSTDQGNQYVDVPVEFVRRLILHEGKQIGNTYRNRSRLV